MDENTLQNQTTKSAKTNKYSIHTMEFRKNLIGDDWKKAEEELILYGKEKAFRIYSNYYEQDGLLSHEIRFDGKRIHGINSLKLCTYHASCWGRACLCVEINLRRFFDISSYPFICIVPAELLKGIRERLCKVFHEWGLPEKWVEDGYIKRADICTNIDLGSENRAAEYLKLLRKGRLPYQFQERKIYSESQKRWITDKNSFTISCDSSEISIYAKHKQMAGASFSYAEEELQLARGQIRLEYRLYRSKIRGIQGKYGFEEELEFVEQIPVVAENELERMLRLMYGTGDFYKMDEIKKRIGLSHHTGATKQKMEDFCRMANGKGGIGRILRGNPAGGRFLKLFDEIGVSPLCIPRRSTENMLHNPLYYIEHCNVNGRE